MTDNEGGDLSERPLVDVVVVTFNSQQVIEACLDSIGRQTYASIEVAIIDNDSADRTEEVVRASTTPLQFFKNASNLGFAGAHNQGIRSSKGAYYLALNPDVVMNPDFIEKMVEAIEMDHTVGAVSGKLLRPHASDGPRLIDSTGMYMTPSLRHLDRGSSQPDRGQYERVQYVFGPSGAAALYSRRMLEDISLDGEYFDEDFFAYREDADLAWRAQLQGWKSLYTPHAVATHERRVLPERRRNLPTEINMHSVKNRFLLRIKNQTLTEFLTLLLPSLFRDLQVIGYVLLREWSSIKGLCFVVTHLTQIWNKRRRIMAKRTTSGREMLRWFRYRPVARSFPANPDQMVPAAK